MLRKGLLLVACSLVAALGALPVHAQDEQAEAEPSTMSGGLIVTHVIAGEAIAEQTFEGGRQPFLDDYQNVGGILAFEVSKATRFEIRLGFAPVTIDDTPNGDIDAQLYTLDFAFVFRFGDEGERVRFGIPVGLGWATLLDDEVFADRGTLPGRNPDIALEGSGGVTYFLGFQAIFALGERTEFVADVRAKRYPNLTNVFNNTVDTTEISLGVLWDF